MPPPIPAATTVGPVHLTVADADRSVGFYERTIGLKVVERAAGSVSLGAGDTELVVLHAQPGARPVPRSSGLFHMALLVPERADLARWLLHAATTRVPLTGLSEHFVSEAIYLDDPDGHGIEIYADRPRAIWEGQVRQRLTTEPLDTQDLLATIEDPAAQRFEALPAATTMGHVHLRVADVRAAIDFYTGILGFEAMATIGDRAGFLAAGGYHHHLGVNSWQSAGAPQAPPGSAALKLATFVLPDAASRDRLADQAADAGHDPQPTADGVLLHDPSGNPIELRASAT
jgi:catechol 2,3-dioxygenase